MDAIGALVADSGAVTGVAAQELATHWTFELNADQVFHPASTMKICVLLELFHQVHSGRVSLSDRIPIRNCFTSIADGSRYSLAPELDSERGLYDRVGESAVLRDLARAMITKSSNLATNLLVDLLSSTAITAFMAELGAPELIVLRGVEDDRAYALGLNNACTARALARVLTLLAEGKAVSPGASREMLAILLEQQFDEGIPAGLPPGTPVAHKTGSFHGTYHDAGIIYPPGRPPYLLVVLTTGLSDDSDGPALVSAISREAHRQLTA